MILSALLTLLAGACYTDGGTIIECPGVGGAVYPSALCRAAPMAAVTDGGACYGIGSPPVSLGCPAAAGSSIAALTTACATHACPTCSTGLYTYLRLEDNLTDETGGHTFAAYSTGSMTYAAGKVGQCDSATAPGQLGFAPNTTLAPGTTWTMAMWAKLTSTPFSGNRPLTNYLGTAQGSYTNNTGASAGNWQYYSGGWTDSTVPYVQDAWTFVLITYDGTTLQYYIDNVTAGSAVKAITLQIDVFAWNNVNVWPGMIDEVGIWTRVLNSTERAALYNSGAGLAYTAW